MTNRVLALDASTKTGWALFVDGNRTASGALPQVKIEDFNVNKDPNLSPLYPYNVVDGADRVVTGIVGELLVMHGPFDVVVVENTNKGKNRHTQRLLEFIHNALLKELRKQKQPMVYMDTSQWRKIAGVQATKEERKANAKLSKAKKAAAAAGTKLDKKALGIKGKVNKKHVAVRMVNELYGLSLIQKDNDEAEAVLMGRAYLLSQTPHPQETA